MGGGGGGGGMKMHGSLGIGWRILFVGAQHGRQRILLVFIILPFGMAQVWGITVLTALALFGCSIHIEWPELVLCNFKKIEK